MTEWPRPQRLAQLLAVLLLALFVAAMLYQAAYQELLYDDAFNASIAKNFGLGLGWVSSYHDYLPFNPRVTTGPTLILPLAAAVALLGPVSWLPSLTNSVLMLCLLMLCLGQLRGQMPRGNWWRCAVAILLLLSLYDRNTWVVFIGDGVLALLLALVFLRLGPALSRGPAVSYWLLGVLCGLALLSKLYALIALVALPVTWCLYHWQHAVRPSVKLPLWFAAGAALLLIPWQLYRSYSLASLAPAALADHAEFSSEFFLKAGSGLGPLLQSDNIPAYLAENLQRNFALLARHLDAYGYGTWLTALLLLCTVAITLRLVLKAGKSEFEWSLTALGLGACAHFGWFLLFMHSPWIHYARIPMILCIFLIPLYFSPALKSRISLGAAVLLLVLLPGEKVQAWSEFMTLQAETARGTRDLSALIEAIPKTEYPQPLAGCGWLVPRMLEYRLPGSKHMQDCMLLIQSQLQQDNPVIGDSKIVLPKPVVFTIPMHNFLWDWAGRGHRMEQSIKQYCTQSLYQNYSYSLLACEVSELSPQLARYLQDYRARS
jgi:hypothetical protein